MKQEKLGIVTTELENDIYVAIAMRQPHMSISLNTARKLLNAIQLLEKINGYDFLLEHE